MYGIHKDLQDFFNGYQGQDPKKASVLIFGIDANYNENISNKSPFFEKILEYNRDGVDFWKKYGRHHPFLLDEYPKEFDKRKGGVPYHMRFAKLNLSSDYAKYISFVELLGVPTIGRTEKKEFWNLFKEYKNCTESLDNIIKDNSNNLKCIFLCPTVYDKMIQIKRHYGLFNWIPDFIERYSKNDYKVKKVDTQLKHKVFSIYHFSDRRVNKQIPEIKQLIEDFCENKNDEEKQ